MQKDILTACMSELKKMSFLVIPLSFLLGLWWGLRLIDFNVDTTSPKVKMLAYSGLVSSSLNQRIQKELQIDVEVKSVSSSNEWLNAFTQEGPYDIVAPMHFQAEQLISRGSLLELSSLAETAAKRVATDFQHLPYDPQGEFTLPLFWGAMGQFQSAEWEQGEEDRQRQREKQKKKRRRKRQKEVVVLTPEPLWVFGRHQLFHFLKKPEDRLVLAPHGLAVLMNPQQRARFSIDQGEATLWVQTLAIDRRSLKVGPALQILEFLTSPELVRSFAESLSQASPYAFSEKWKVAAELKPSFLRELPLRNIRWLEPLSDFKVSFLEGRLAAKEASPADPPRPD